MNYNPNFFILFSLIAPALPWTYLPNALRGKNFLSKLGMICKVKISYCCLCFSVYFNQIPFSFNFILGPANWAGICSTGKRQSPIDIKSSETTLDTGLGSFTLKNYDRKLNKTFTGSNNGHSLGVSFPGGVYNVSGGGLKDVYTTVQFHFHYGPNNTVGSEHIVDGEHYAAEVSTRVNKKVLNEIVYVVLSRSSLDKQKVDPVVLLNVKFKECF